MHQLQFLQNLNHFNLANRSAIDELTKIRNNLLLSLISQLSYNRILLSISEIIKNSQSKGNEVKLQQTQQSCYKVNHAPFKKNRKIKRFRPTSKLQISSIKNDTKNIPKNYGKAILTFILKSTATIKVASMLGLNIPQFLTHIRKLKNKINSIDGLRKMWGSDQIQNKTKKCIRILSYYFMRRHCLRYIFYSKVRNFGTHIKYRQKLIQGIENPLEFSHIKDY